MNASIHVVLCERIRIVAIFCAKMDNKGVEDGGRRMNERGRETRRVRVSEYAIEIECKQIVESTKEN